MLLTFFFSFPSVHTSNFYPILQNEKPENSFFAVRNTDAPPRTIRDLVMGNLDEEVEESFSLRASGQLFFPAQQTLYLYRIQYRVQYRLLL